MQPFLTELERLAAVAAQEFSALSEAGRSDEATFQRIRINIYDICRTVYQVCARMAQGQAQREMYLSKLNHLTGTWQAALLAAQTHGDTQKAFIEQLKLDTLLGVRALYLDMEPSA